jgi:hypothetical protein
MLTDANLCDPVIYKQMEECAKHLELEKEHLGDRFPSDAEIVLEWSSSDGQGCLYYCVDHAERTIFWMNSMDISWMLAEVKGIDDLSQTSKM